MYLRNDVISAVTGIAIAISVPAAAQEAQTASNVSSDDIVVTARKREERILDVPASLDVVSGDRLLKTGITRLDELQQIAPGLKFSGGPGARVSIRGIGNNISGIGADASAAINFDGVYIPRSPLALFDLYDVERVEVLKGPEGTLYGRNATAGVINIVTRGPDDRTSAEGFLGAGSFGLRRAQAAANLGFEGGGLRVGVDYGRDDGYTKNLADGGRPLDAVDYLSFRAKLKVSLTDSVRLTLTGQTVRDDGTIGYGASNNPLADNYAALGAQRESPRRVNVDPAIFHRQRGYIGSARIDADLGAVDFTSITGYVHYKNDELSDTDGAGAFIEQASNPYRSNFFSQEFQLRGTLGQRLRWTAGAYYSQEHLHEGSLLVDQDFPDPPPYVYLEYAANVLDRNYAVFGEAEIDLSDRLALTLGGRYTHETKRGNSSGSVLFEPFSGSGRISNDAFTPKAVLQFKLSDDNRIYASATRGFKSGGINVSNPVATFAPEKIWAYEIGTKNSFLGGRFELNAAAFYYDYTDLQLRTAVYLPDGGAIVRVTNAARAPIKGADVSVAVVPAAGLRFSGSAAYLDGNLRNFVSPATGAILNIRLPEAPKWQLNGAIDVERPLAGGTLSVHGEVVYQTTVIFPLLGNPALERQPGYALLNGSIRYDFPREPIYVALIGRNLGNRRYFTDRFVYEGFSDLQFFGAPRSIEARVGFKF